MKKFLCLVLSIISLTLCACQSDTNIAAVYDEPGRIPTHVCRLDPSSADDTRLALLLRKYDESASVVAVSDGPGGEMTAVYSLPDSVMTYEITANEGLIAFYELTTYSDGSVNYALKVIDTNNNNKVHSPYKKTVTDENDIQTRFIAVYDGCVYYLTKSNLLGRCRVMKYSVKDKELTEYLGFDFTENEMTAGSSCTFISEKSGYLTCGVVDGNRTVLKTYDLKTNELVREKQLPYGATLVYMADHDYAAGTYAMYYISAQGDERVAVFSYEDADVTDLLKMDENTYVNREEVRLENGKVYFEIQDTSKESPYDQFTGMAADTVSKIIEEYEGCIRLFLNKDAAYILCFDKKSGSEKMILKKSVG
ncbi:MAG: hypothetical protein IJT49_01550 [Clostridia bacterium]|nr:hypothetical protein [Clostridia bacterium]